MAWCSKRRINIVVVAGVAHWQNGVVDRCIKTFKWTYDKLLSEVEADQGPVAPSTYYQAARL
eukprot:521843-Lingulodinium_polyedra.AAC.1